MLTDSHKKTDTTNSNKMDYNLVQQVIDLLNDFDQACKKDGKLTASKQGFIDWVVENNLNEIQKREEKKHFPFRSVIKTINNRISKLFIS